MAHSPLTRLAPTPSGFLHLGNLANFLFTEKLAKERGAEIRLRIDDCDGTRTRPEFVEHIFDTLGWLQIEWREGPRDAAEFHRAFSQVSRKSSYFAKLSQISSLTYACRCSRKEAGGIYPGTCRERSIPFVAGETALRLKVQDPSLAAKFGDVVLWRKDDGPAYHWVSVVDDLDWGVSLIVRGEDLRESSDLQKHIASLVSPDGFRGVEFVHHPLLTDQGQKLSKSRGALSVVEMRKSGRSAAEIRRQLSARIEEWGRNLF